MITAMQLSNLKMVAGTSTMLVQYTELEYHIPYYQRDATSREFFEMACYYVEEFHDVVSARDAYITQTYHG